MGHCGELNVRHSPAPSHAVSGTMSKATDSVSPSRTRRVPVTRWLFSIRSCQVLPSSSTSRGLNCAPQAPSHVLQALNVSADVAKSAIRFSLGALSTEASVDRVAEVFPMLVEKARRLAPA